MVYIEKDQKMSYTVKIYMYQKIEIKRKLFSLVCVLTLSCVLFVQTALAFGELSLVDQAAQNPLIVQAFDTVSGIEGLIKINGGMAMDSVSVTVTNSSSTLFLFSKTLDSRGALELVVPSSSTQKEGIYNVVVHSTNQVGFTHFSVFGNSSTSSNGIGGDDNLVAVDAVVNRFEIENIPSSVTIGDRLNFTIKAVDLAGVVVPTYRGTVHFSSTDRNAQLPEDYTFVPSDQGQRTFDLAATLRTNGTQKIIADDKDDATIRGEKSIDVLRGAF